MHFKQTVDPIPLHEEQTVSNVKYLFTSLLSTLVGLQLSRRRDYNQNRRHTAISALYGCDARQQGRKCRTEYDHIPYYVYYDAPSRGAVVNLCCMVPTANYYSEYHTKAELLSWNRRVYRSAWDRFTSILPISTILLQYDLLLTASGKEERRCKLLYLFVLLYCLLFKSHQKLE
jgi:hypothetical protein